METPGRFTMNHRDSMMLAEDISAFGGSQMSIEGPPRLSTVGLTLLFASSDRHSCPKCVSAQTSEASMLCAGQLQAGIAVT